MMRFILIQMMLVGLVFAESPGADIFGLKMGMSVSEIRALGLVSCKRHRTLQRKFGRLKIPGCPKTQTWPRLLLCQARAS